MLMGGVEVGGRGNSLLLGRAFPSATAGTLSLFICHVHVACPVFTSVCSGARMLRFKFRLCQLLAMQPWATPGNLHGSVSSSVKWEEALFRDSVNASLAFLDGP